MPLQRKASLAGAALLLTAMAAAVPAAQLDDQTCRQIKSDIVQLEGQGVRENIARGAAWGKANLDRAKLEQIKKLIEMDEAVAFRCPRPKPAPAVADPDAAVPAKGKAVAKVKPGEGQPRPKPKAKTQTGEGNSETSEAAQPQQQAQPKPRPRPTQPKPAETKPTEPKPGQ